MSDEAPVVGTLIIGPLSTVEDADAAACALLGYAKSALVGLHGSELVRREDRAAVAAAIDQMRHGDFSVVAPAILKRKDGSVLSVEVRAHRLANDRLALTVRAQRAGVST
jgi:PAS domain S-box-containing protein